MQNNLNVNGQIYQSVHRQKNRWSSSIVDRHHTHNNIQHTVQTQCIRNNITNTVMSWFWLVFFSVNYFVLTYLHVKKSLNETKYSIDKVLKRLKVLALFYSFLRDWIHFSLAKCNKEMNETCKRDTLENEKKEETKLNNNNINEMKKNTFK